MAISVFISTVTDEFLAYREQLRRDLTRQNVAVKVQEDLKRLGGYTLDTLDTYIADCDAVVHLAGDMSGAPAGEIQQERLLARYPDLAQRLPPLGRALKTGVAVSYTHWEAWLALYHGKQLYVAAAAQAEERGPNYKPTDQSRAAQAAHLTRLREAKFYPFEFTSPDHLAKQVLASGILDLLAKDYARAHGAVAEGFVAEMAKRVAGDKQLDLDGMMQAVRNAIEIYEKEIAGRPVETNLDDIAARALASAKEQMDRGQSALARATLRRAAEEMQRDEKDRRERFEAGVTALYGQARDIALAAYDGDAAADAIVELGRSIHRANTAKLVEFLNSEAQALYDYGGERGSNVHLVATIAVLREQLRLASSDQRAGALNLLGSALFSLGERDSGTARLEEAVAAYGAGLEELTRERDPLSWATTQNNLGNALFRLGERESGAARLKESVEAYRAALEEWTRKQVPLDWAIAQNNLGAALAALGERESGTAQLEEAIEAYRAALEEGTREKDPLLWAATQNNLGDALETLGERENETARLEEAVAAYRAALEEWTRKLVPLDWARAQNNLGYALAKLGEQDCGTERLEEAVAACRVALDEWTRERAPLDWAMTQNNLGYALAKLGERESRTGRLEEAVAAYGAALDEFPRERASLDWAESFGGQGIALMLIADRSNNGVKAEAAVQPIRAAYETARSGGDEAAAMIFEAQLPKAQSICDRLKGK